MRMGVNSHSHLKAILQSWSIGMPSIILVTDKLGVYCELMYPQVRNSAEFLNRR
jgi:hypothetical protein